MKIIVSSSQSKPIYEQIKTQILEAILAKELSAGELLPSLRTLAKELKVGVLTINRAYAELESEGYIQNMQGKGCYVAACSLARIKQHLLEEARGNMMHAIYQASKAGLTDAEILAAFQQYLLESEKPDIRENWEPADFHKNVTQNK